MSKALRTTPPPYSDHRQFPALSMLADLAKAHALPDSTELMTWKNADEVEGVELPRLTIGDIKAIITALDVKWMLEQELACTLLTAIHRAEAAREAGDDEAAIDLEVRHVRPLRATLNNAISGDAFISCEPCGKPIRPGDELGFWDDIGSTHKSCGPGNDFGLDDQYDVAKALECADAYLASLEED